MRDLFLSELRRFRNAALIFAAVHLVLQVFVHRMSDLLHWPWQQQLVVLALFMLAALAFALYQFGTYRQPSRWVWLLHRPLPRREIFIAIAGASLALIAAAVGLPALLAVLLTDLATTRTVDLRHYLLVPYLMLMAGMAWTAGAYVILHRSRTAIVALLLPLLLVAHMASAVTMTLLAVPCAALMAFIAYSAFTPNRQTQADGAAALAATALPLLLAFYFALTGIGSTVFQFGQMFLGVHPNNIDVPPAYGYPEAVRADSGKLFARGLEFSTDPQAAHWRRQVALLKPVELDVDASVQPVRHQLGNAGDQQWLEEAAQTVWTFSHDAMRFQGRDAVTGQPRGWLGRGGLNDAAPFPEPTVEYGEGQLLSRRHVYRFDPATRAVRELVALPPSERLLAGLQKAGERQYLLTTRRLVAYTPEADGALAERYSVPLTGHPVDLARVDVADLLDGTLLSFTYGRKRLDGVMGNEQVIVHVDGAGRARTVARRELFHDFPVLFEHYDWWASPLLYAALTAPDHVLDKGHAARFPNPLTLPRPAVAWIAALACALLAAAGAHAWLRRTDASPRRKAGWTAACLLLGLPCLLALTVLEPRRAPIPLPARTPASHPEPIPT